MNPRKTLFGVVQEEGPDCLEKKKEGEAELEHV